MTLRLLPGAAVAAGALAVGALGFPAVAAAESNLAPSMVTTTLPPRSVACSL